MRLGSSKDRERAPDPTRRKLRFHDKVQVLTPSNLLVLDQLGDDKPTGGMSRAGEGKCRILISRTNLYLLFSISVHLIK